MSEYIPTFTEFLAESVVIDINKNPQPSPKLGVLYGQDVEPVGTYVSSGKSTLPGYLNGRAVLKNPLYIQITDDTNIEYKRELAKEWGATGKRLTNKLMRKGYDGIITVYSNGDYGEIVLFPGANYILA